ncbi:hypothetical protein LK07_24085 [Streptomyces pluripotens]|uniref:Uncharacterized protein n=1 Tax=Streptomyces pluripotens TaxID=1355015 RepID=A0A221P2W9_9ACTN|nr:hypothetical protein LK06_022920 [Streptomyces pluripotens]ASN26581.1 hypothetical protein LK07_24085 [Streptomyces pluripotens]
MLLADGFFGLALLRCESCAALGFLGSLLNSAVDVVQLVLRSLRRAAGVGEVLGSRGSGSFDEVGLRPGGREPGDDVAAVPLVPVSQCLSRPGASGRPIGQGLRSIREVGLELGQVVVAQQRKRIGRFRGGAEGHIGPEVLWIVPPSGPLRLGAKLGGSAVGPGCGRPTRQ